jgi:type IV pilus assembly protein PilB
MNGLGAMLVEQGLVTVEQLEEADEAHREKGRSLGRVLVDRGYLGERDLVRALASQIGLDFVDLSEAEIDPIAASMISETLAKRYNVLPLRLDANGALIVAMSDPANVFALDDIRSITKRDLVPVVATRDDVQDAIRRLSKMGDEIESIADDFGTLEEDLADLSGLTVVSEEPPIVKFVNLLISQAVNDGASDIHIEPGERDLRVRYRVDGVLHEVMRSPKSIQSGVISRLKIMAEVDIAERRIPQDGRIALNIAGKAIDLRFSTLPTVYGEKVVMRILDRTSVMLELRDLGFEPDNERRYEESYRKPYGLILVTGPTGSGKSTTLYATLNVKNNADINIVTTEDPVEYRLPGINQVQINNKVGLTFATALRSILRQDPDVVLVGEMRDKETATIGVEAALTGHLVLSTLHTNDAASAIIRLTEMGVEPFLVASATDCVLAQRLCRRVCKKCTMMQTLEPDAYILAGYSEELAESRPAVPKLTGCSSCGKTGYKGRLAVHEIMTVTEEIERMCVARASSDDIKRMSIEQGMLTMRDDGLAKVLSGITTIEEIGRVVV